MRLTSDNPMINSRLVKYSLDSHLKSNQKFSSTRKMIKKKIIRFFPKGHSIDIINKEELLKINTKYLSKFEKEHIIPYLYKNIKCNFIKNKKLKQNLNLKSASLDTLEDYFKII